MSVPNVVSDSPPSSATSMKLDSAPNSGSPVTLSKAYESVRNPEEKAHWNAVCRAYRQYAQFAVNQFGLNHPSRISNLLPSHQALLPKHLICGTPQFEELGREYKDAAIRNQFFLDCVLRHAGKPHSQQLKDPILSTDISKVTSVLKSVARDWSAAGQPERTMAYRPILQSLDAYIVNTKNGPPRKICVPGAGLGRLACEIASKGYTVQDFILNGPMGSGIPISPWLLETKNILSPRDPLRKVVVPDVDPFSLVGDSGSAEFSMAAGDFNSIYGVDSEANQWDGVIASFFLDAVSNVIQTLEVIFHMLKPGGCLISFGPLHWHWSGPSMGLADESVGAYRQRWKHLDQRYLESIDLPWEDVQEILKNIGFEIVRVNLNQKAYYTSDTKSMLQTEYRCIHFVARKPRLSASVQLS